MNDFPYTIIISEEFKKTCSDFTGLAVYANVINSLPNPDLWLQIDNFSQQYKESHQIEDIKKNPNITATRVAYKAFGKDPNRYRPSAEALCRRIIRELPLYRIDTLVDIINFVSMKTGYSIGGFDASKIEGDSIVLGIGKHEEPYEGIGRGLLNIEGLPVYRDALGGIGTPTSDNERTKITLETTSLLVIFNGYKGKEGLSEAGSFISELLNKYLDCSNIEYYYF